MALPGDSGSTTRVPRLDECWRWPVGSVTKDGRSRLRWGFVYRILYIMLVNPDLDPEMDLHHTCRQGWCVNPWHLQELTRKEHTALHRKIKPRITVCKNGHDLTDPDNVFTTTRRSGPRAGKQEQHCRPCIVEWKRRRRAELKAEREATH